MEKSLKKILVINLGGMGDFLLSTPALKALRYFFNEAKISFLGPSSASQIAKSSNYIDTVYSFNITHNKIPAIRLLHNISTLVKLRRINFDLAINMRTIYSPKSAKKLKLLLAMVNAKKSAGRNTEGWGDFLDIKIPETQFGHKHESEYDIDTANALGAIIGEKSFELNISEAADKKSRDLLEGFNIGSDDTVIGINPGGMPSRRWPIESFKILIQRLREKINFVKFIITGSRDERVLTRGLEHPDTLILTGKLSPIELSAVIRHTKLFISNDTGPMHIAAILGVPLVAIMGPGDLVRFDPRNISPNASMLYRQTPCAPCEKFFCSRLKCLKAISVDDVLHEAYKQLEI
jgi:ADP-heptose:LPS heptosyltransferase